MWTTARATGTTRCSAGSNSAVPPTRSAPALPTRLEQLRAFRVRRPLPGIQVTTMRYRDDHESQSQSRQRDHLGCEDTTPPRPAHGWLTATTTVRATSTSPSPLLLVESNADMVSTLSPTELMLKSSHRRRLAPKPGQSRYGNVLTLTSPPGLFCGANTKGNSGNT